MPKGKKREEKKSSEVKKGERRKILSVEGGCDVTPMRGRTQGWVVMEDFIVMKDST